MKLLWKDISKATGSLYLSAGRDAVSEAAIHAVYDIFNEDDTEAVLLVDASNAFNSINREALLHNTRVLYPVLATFINNFYLIPSGLFIQGGKPLKSLEGMTQGDPVAMGIYALEITPLLAWVSRLLKEETERFPLRKVAFADDLNGVGSLENWKKWWDLLEQKDRNFSYHVKASKSHTIIKLKYHDKAKQVFQGSKITIINTWGCLL